MVVTKKMPCIEKSFPKIYPGYALDDVIYKRPPFVYENTNILECEFY